VAGFRVLKVRPEADGTRWPSISNSLGVEVEAGDVVSRE
jgi:hypothetical protein